MLSRDRLECIELVDLCLRLGKPGQIIPPIIDGYSVAQAPRMLEAQANPPASATPPDAAASWQVELEQAVAARLAQTSPQKTIPWRSGGE
jgi:hypothetical protein